ncbi:TIGR03032 family protein [Crassaminicella profunda]|uniref:TIGR03032 family protein n=1 Tax=Crassaminicella profunda TaxID=1286698 RepID=UPI001CA74A7B|nr:TIGR03032 family protein [Crassaminicella profunda]QZY54102.1 TIGR03032 family protein [Crassaminicella profunda]
MDNNNRITAKRPFSCTYTKDVIEILDGLNISLILSTYQAGKVIILSSDGKNMFQLVRDFARPMGIALKEDMMALAGALNVTVFKTDEHLAKTYPNKQDTYDAFYFPTTLFRTDYVDIHDIAFTNMGLVGVNTSFSCLSRLDGRYSFEPIWKPKFIKEFVPEDLCHLNGMAVDEKSNIRYVTAFAKTSSREGWRKNKLTGGVLIDTKTNEIILESLPMPHSPRVYKGEVYLLLSATEELIKVDIKNKTYKVIAKMDGFIRGLSFKDDYAFIGVSKLRKTHTFSDLEIAEKDIHAGVVIVNIKTGKILGEIKYENSVDELYDVHVLDGIKRANILNYQQSLDHRALITPYGCSWIENRDAKEKDEEKKEENTSDSKE